MSEASTIVTAELFRYIAAHTMAEDAFLRELKQAAIASGLPAIWIAPEQAAFMHILLRLCKARHVVEVGALAGYAAIWMARALPADGKLRTIEVSPKHADFAERWIGRSDVADRVEVVRGNAREILPGVADRWADAVFLDADKASYPLYLKECLRIVRPGGLVMADNAFAFGEVLSDSSADREAPAMRAFNEIVAQTNELRSVIVPLGDGLWVAVRE